MKFVHARSEIKVRRFVNIIDGPNIPHPNSGVKGKEIVLTKLEVYFVLVAGEWKVSGATQSVYGEGWILTREGKRSQRMWRGQITTAPSRTENAWLKKIIDGMRPTGSPDLPFDVTEV